MCGHLAFFEEVFAHKGARGKGQGSLKGSAAPPCILPSRLPLNLSRGSSPWQTWTPHPTRSTRLMTTSCSCCSCMCHIRTWHRWQRPAGGSGRRAPARYVAPWQGQRCRPTASAARVCECLKHLTPQKCTYPCFCAAGPLAGPPARPAASGLLRRRGPVRQRPRRPAPALQGALLQQPLAEPLTPDPVAGAA